jgi:hypothetical protein
MNGQLGGSGFISVLLLFKANYRLNPLSAPGAAESSPKVYPLGPKVYPLGPKVLPFRNDFGNLARESHPLAPVLKPASYCCQCS